MAIAVLHEHPEWNAPLFAELGRRDVEFTSLNASETGFDPTVVGWSLLFNRMSASAWTRGHREALDMTPTLLREVESARIPVVNGSTAFSYEISKRHQIDLFARENIRHPRTRPVFRVGEVVAAASGLVFPLLIKPNTGGSGVGISAFDTLLELETAVDEGVLNLGPDGTGLIQERLPARGESIVRIEILGGGLLYAIRLKLQPDSFNLCPADYCLIDGSTVDPADLVSRIDPPAELVETARRIIAVAGADLGSVEYLLNDRDGEAYFYDVNINSNYVADATRILGFDPFSRLVDYLMVRSAFTVQASGSVQTSAVPSSTTTSS